MALTPGTKLGPYEILSVAGSGGMGVVYRGRDTRLDRIVAIKVLPETLLPNPVSRQRLEREARAVSVLSHPAICTLHDIGHQDGVDYLVMEYLEGETLAQRLQKGPLPIDAVLRFGMQIAGALDAAHRRGFVHRDLKPGNIMLTPTGAKLLDFGLAKISLPSAEVDLTAEVTRATPLTQEGAVAGTFPYMSPEQIEGKEVDARSDVFSFGSVLYEMATGRRAFTGKSQISLASAILEKEPEPIGRLRPLTPQALECVIQVCLAKNPEDRWQSARDVLLQLKWLYEPSSQPALPTPGHGRSREPLAWLTAAALAVATAIAAAGWWQDAHVAPPRLPMRVSVELPPGKIIDRFMGAQLALSPDGTQIVVAEKDASGKYRLAVRSLDQSGFVPVSDTESARVPFFSPDGRWIGFFAGGKLKKIAVQGGVPVTLCDAPSPIRGASWGDDGTIIAAFNQGSSGLVRIPSGGGAPVEVTSLAGQKAETAHAWPQVLPGSQAVLLTVYGTAYDDAEIAVVSLKAGERKTLHRGGFYGRYLPSGQLVYLQQDTLWAAPFDLGRLALTGAPQPVLEEVNGNFLAGGDFAFAQTGTFAYVSSKGGVLFPRSIGWLDSAGKIESLGMTPGRYENPRLSPDGRRLAFELATAMERADIWVRDLERNITTRVTHLPGRNNWPVWTPDGKSIAFSSYLQPASGIYWVSADGAGEAQRLTESKTFQSPCSFSPDGKWLSYSQWSADFRMSEIYTVPVEGDHDHPRLGKAEAFLRSSFYETVPAFSPDGRWLAYSSNESGNRELYVRPFPGPGGKSQISIDGGSHPIWSRDGRQLFFLTPDGRIMVVDYIAGHDSFSPGKPRVWSQKTMPSLGGNYPYDLAPDGKRFAVVMNLGTAEEQVGSTDSVTVLLNFFDELRRKVPAGKN
jgi:Tol biopolymer transport system component